MTAYKYPTKRIYTPTPSITSWRLTVAHWERLYHVGLTRRFYGYQRSHRLNLRTPRRRTLYGLPGFI